METSDLLSRVEFEVKETVYIKNDPDQAPRTIIGLYITENEIRYDVSNGSSSVYCYGYQLSRQKDFKI